MQLLVNLVFDPEYRGYAAEVPELPGCMSEGKTIEQALMNVREAIVLYLETTPRRRRQLTRSPPFSRSPVRPAQCSGGSGA
jgi:predicted RNase H-like HicB family nuclease